MNKEEYINGELVFDDQGIKIDIDGVTNIIMGTEEEGWMRHSVLELCRRIKPKIVFEVGFGLGYSAQAFQDSGVVEKHIIIEPHPKIFDRALEWAKDKTNVILLKGFLQDVVIEGPVDLIFDDRYELVFQELFDYSVFDFKYLALPSSDAAVQYLPSIPDAAAGYIFDYKNGQLFQPLFSYERYKTHKTLHNQDRRPCGEKK